MQIPVIKAIIEKYTIEELIAAEIAILNEEIPVITIEGKDEGEQLTHILAALWCKHEIQKRGIATAIAIREYGIKVRTSIS